MRALSVNFYQRVVGGGVSKQPAPRPEKRECGCKKNKKKPLPEQQGFLSFN